MPGTGIAAPLRPSRGSHLILRAPLAQACTADARVHSTGPGPLAPLRISRSSFDLTTVSPISREDFVGRERELAALGDALDEARLGRGGAVLVVGAGGVGKTALVQERSARSDSVLFVWGHCARELAGRPFQPWLEVLTTLRETSTAREELDQLLVELQTSHEQRANERLDPETARFLILQRLSRALQHEAESRAVAIVLDDLHLADLASASFAAQLVDTPYATRVLLIGVHRELAPDADPALAASLQRIARSKRRIELGALSVDEIAHYAELVAKETPTRSQVDTLQRRSGGNLVFLRELLRSEAGSDAEQRVPRTLAHLIDARLQTLQSEDRELVELAAVIGRETPLLLLARAAGSHRRDARRRIDRAAALGILTPLSADSDQLEFPHELVREAVYLNLSLVRRATLHGAVARALETLHAGSADPPWGVLAHHHGESDAADGAERAGACAEAAARRAFALFAFEDAANHFGAALHWLEFGPPLAAAREAQLLLELGRAHLHAGDPSRAARDLAQASLVARAGDAIEPLAHATVELAAIQPGNAGSPLGERIALFEEVLLQLPPAHAALRAELQIALASDLAAADPQRARTTSDAAIAKARQLRDGGLLLRAISSRAQLLLYPNDPREREAFAREEAAIARSQRDRSAEVLAHQHVFANALARGDRAAVDEAANACERAAAALGHPMYRGHAAAALAARALWQGDLLLAEQFSDEATRALADHRSHELAFLVATSQRFVLRRFQGRLPELAPQLEAALRVEPNRLALHCVLSLLYASTGRDDDARASLAFVVERCSDGRQLRLPADLCRSMNVAMLAETCGYLRDAGTAAALELELEIAGDGNLCLGSLVCVGSVQRYRGLVAHARGDDDQAISFLEDAIEWEKHVGARPLEAYAVLDCARVALARGAPGDDELVRTHTARALQLAAGMNMPTILAAAGELAYAR